MATEPANVPAQVDISLGGGVAVRWSDGHLSQYTIAALRQACPCATCHDARRKPLPPPSPLPMYQPIASTLLKVEPVGRYALQFYFSDRHSTGIYTWEFLRSLCPCPVCHPGSK